MKIHRKHHPWPKGLCVAVLALAAMADMARADAAEYLVIGNIGEAVETGEASLTRPGASVGANDELARAPIAAGRFRITGEMVDTGVVTLTAVDADGNRKGSARFVLEPGETRISYAGAAMGFVADGGPYNQLLINSLQESDEYQRALAQYAHARAATTGLDKGPEHDSLMAELVSAQNALNWIRGEALRDIASSDDDPLASFLAIALGAFSGPEALERLDELEAVAELPASAGALRARNETLTRMMANSRRILRGDKIDGFAAAGLDGDTYRLQDALAENKLVLIEFWASWCGPCRADVPNLKAAVEQYGDRGFAIFAFSLDTDREDWEDASLTDGIPWINTGDLKGYDSPISQQFAVGMLPKNLLVDANGVVVDVHARGDPLMERLAEMLGDDG